MFILFSREGQTLPDGPSTAARECFTHTDTESSLQYPTVPQMSVEIRILKYI
jgi:hypothetical protein